MFTPAILSFMHRPKILEIEKEERHRWVDNFLKKLSIFSLNKRAGTIVVCIFIAILLTSVFGIKNIVVGDNSEGSSYLYANSPYNVAERFINTNFGGTNSYYLLAESDGSLLKPKKLKAIDNLQIHLLRETLQAGSADSLVNAIKALNMFMLDGKRENFFIPESERTISEYWFLYTYSGFPSDFDHVISKDEKIANIKFDLKDHKSTTVDYIVNKTKEYLKTYKPKDVKFSYAGGDIGILYATNDIIKKTIIPSILCISLLIFLYVSFVYRSFAAGGLLLLPLFISNVIVFSFFGFFGTSLTVETLPLVSLSGGLGVNYGIYILARLYEEMREKKKTYKNILYHTLVTSGKAVFFSGFIVSLGISAWAFSAILLQVKLGLNLCVSLMLNMITSLIMLPVFVWWIKPRFLFGKVRVRFVRRK